MIILLSSAILGVLLFIIPIIWDFWASIITKCWKFLTSKYWKKEPNKDSKFRIIRDKENDIYIQFSNNGGKTYHNFGKGDYYSEKQAKEMLDDIINKLNKTDEILYEYDPNCLRITDGSEKEFMEEDDL